MLYARRRDGLSRCSLLKEKEIYRLSLPYTVVSDAVCVRLTGELDHHTIGPLRADIDACIRRTGARCLVLDATDVPFMDSSVIGLILGRLELVRSRGGEVRVVGLSAGDVRS